MSSLDGLRGAAALAVFLAHQEGLHLGPLPMGHLLAYAKPAVYLFFALSSFLLTLIWLRSRAPTAPRTFGRYALRRVLRVVPLYALVLLCTALTMSHWPGYQAPILREFSMANLPGHLLFLEGKGVFWTVAVEFRYYAVLPLVVLLLRPLRRTPLAAVAGVGALVGAGVVAWPAEALPLQTLHLGPYLPIFLLGGLAAFLHWSWAEAAARGSRRVRIAMECAAVVSLAGVVALNGMFWSIPGNPLVRSMHFSKAYFAFGLLWAVFLVAHLNGTGVLRRVFSWGPLRFLGAISFSLYLLHLPVIFAVHHWLAPPDWNPFLRPSALQVAVTIAAGLGLSTLTYLGIERPFMQLGGRRRAAKPGGSAARNDDETPTSLYVGGASLRR